MVDKEYGLSIMISKNHMGKPFKIKSVKSRLYIWFLPLFIKVVFIF